METNKRITILSPTYNEEENIEELVSRIEKVFSQKLTNYEYEIIFIDNSSTDKTVDIIKNKINHNKNIKLIVNQKIMVILGRPFMDSNKPALLQLYY